MPFSGSTQSITSINCLEIKSRRPMLHLFLRGSALSETAGKCYGPTFPVSIRVFAHKSHCRRWQGGWLATVIAPELQLEVEQKRTQISTELSLLSSSGSEEPGAFYSLETITVRTSRLPQPSCEKHQTRQTSSSRESIVIVGVDLEERRPTLDQLSTAARTLATWSQRRFDFLLRPLGGPLPIKIM